MFSVLKIENYCLTTAEPYTNVTTYMCIYISVFAINYHSPTTKKKQLPY